MEFTIPPESDTPPKGKGRRHRKFERWLNHLHSDPSENQDRKERGLQKLMREQRDVYK